MHRYAIPNIDLRKELAERGLECHLLVAYPQTEARAVFPALLCSELQELTYAAYGKVLTEDHLRYETWGVTLREIEPPHAIVACSTLSFTMDQPSYFHTHFEAVHPDRQRTGLGRLLYDCLAVWTRFLALNDPIALDGITNSKGQYCLVSTIDRSGPGHDDDDDDDDDDERIPSPTDITSCSSLSRDDDNAQGHGAFLKSIGFERAVHDFRQNHRREIAFQRDFRIPLADCEEDPGSA